MTRVVIKEAQRKAARFIVRIEAIRVEPGPHRTLSWAGIRGEGMRQGKRDVGWNQDQG